MLAVHISNRYVDLEPIVAKAAAEDGKNAFLVDNEGDAAEGISRSSWILVSSREDIFNSPAFKNAKPVKAPDEAEAATEPEAATQPDAVTPPEAATPAGDCEGGAAGVD